jgi:hypothetical protein
MMSVNVWFHEHPSAPNHPDGSMCGHAQRCFLRAGADELSEERLTTVTTITSQHYPHHPLHLVLQNA